MEKKIIIVAMLILTIGCTKEEETKVANVTPPPPPPIVWYDIYSKWVNNDWIINVKINQIDVYPIRGGFGNWDTYKWTQIDNNNGFFKRRYNDTIFVEMINDTICNFRCTYPGDSLPKTLQFERN